MYERENLFTGYPMRDAVLRTYQRYFTKFPSLENAVFSKLPLSFCPAVSIARSEIYFSPEACAELSKIPACRLARASTLRRNAKSVIGAPSFFGPRPWENIRCKFNAESGETGGITKKNTYNFQINRPIFGQEEKIYKFISFRIFLSLIFSFKADICTFSFIMSIYTSIE